MSLFARRMKIYTVQVRPDQSDHVEFVREGFNFLAFLFTGFWTLYHRLWWHTLALFALNAVVVAVGRAGWLSPDSIAVLQLGIQVIVGFHGNDWLRWKWEKQGYVMADVTASDSLLGAEQRYFERHLAAHTS